MAIDWVSRSELSPLDRRSLDLGRAHGWKPCSAIELLRNWDALVCECEQGSILSIDDYLSDLFVRDYAQMVLDSDDARACEDYLWWSARMAEVDARLKHLFRHDVEVVGQPRWWRRGVLKAGGPQYDEQSIDVLMIRKVEAKP